MSWFRTQGYFSQWPMRWGKVYHSSDWETKLKMSPAQWTHLAFLCKMWSQCFFIRLYPSITSSTQRHRFSGLKGPNSYQPPAPCSLSVPKKTLVWKSEGLITFTVLLKFYSHKSRKELGGGEGYQEKTRDEELGNILLVCENTFCGNMLLWYLTHYVLI